MGSIIRGAGVLGMFALLASGCATIDEGAIDYGRTSAFLDTREQTADTRGRNVYNKYLNLYASTESENHCTSTQSVLKKGDTIAVFLTQANIFHFHEPREKFYRAFGHGRIQGEIAIIAQVKELDSETVIDFDPASTNNAGRVVYYSDDVRLHGHYLNFSSLPVYGPIEYNGKPLLLQFSILDLDTTSPELEAVLGVLAQLGKSSFIPASPVLKTLEEVGGQLLQGDKDDRIFRYFAVLYPEKIACRHGEPIYPRIETGTYFFVKSEFKGGSRPPFDYSSFTESFCYNESTGRLHESSDSSEGACCLGELVTDRTYLTVQIHSGFDAVAENFSQTVAEFMDSRSTRLKAAGSSLEDFKESFGNILDRRAGVEKARELSNRITGFEDMEEGSQKVLITEIIEFLRGDWAERIRQTDDYTDLIRKIREQAMDPLTLDIENVVSEEDSAATSLFEALTGERDPAPESP